MLHEFMAKYELMILHLSAFIALMYWGVNAIRSHFAYKKASREWEVPDVIWTWHTHLMKVEQLAEQCFLKYGCRSSKMDEFLAELEISRKFRNTVVVPTLARDRKENPKHKPDLWPGDDCGSEG